MVFRMQGPLNDLQGLTALVTGASTGIGLETALALARRGARLWMVSRDPIRGAEALRSVNAISQGVEARLILQDLGCRAGVRAAAEEFLQSGEPLHILVNNAAGVFFERTETVDGIEATFALNHLAPFHLTLLLLKRIVASAPARIVNVSSAGHAPGSHTSRRSRGDPVLLRLFSVLQHQTCECPVYLRTGQPNRGNRGSGPYPSSGCFPEFSWYEQSRSHALVVEVGSLCDEQSREGSCDHNLCCDRTRSLDSQRELLVELPGKKIKSPLSRPKSWGRAMAP